MTMLVFAAMAVLPFNDGWEFQRKGEGGWSVASIPHDATYGLPLSPDEDHDHGFAPSPETRYRKIFARPNGDGHFSLKFDGVYMDSQVFVNGRLAGGRRNGYLPFEVPLDDLGATNVVEVVCRAPTPNTRWYSGVGILRDVWLVRREGWTLEPEAMSVSTELRGDGAAIVRVRVAGAKVVEPAGGELVVENPALWTPETPNLHWLSVTAENAVGERDAIRIRYGIRTIEFTKDRGMFLNGKPYRIKGMCQHDTFGAFGAAFNLSELKRQLAALKDLGANAIRTAHNPFAPCFYDLCDEMGFLVMNEAFDQWRISKTKFGYSQFFDECWKQDLADFVRRDRNHPCVVLWSIGNEIRDVWQGDRGSAIARDMVNVVHTLDHSRPVTAGIDHPAEAYTNGVMDALDVVGLNYNADWYAKLRGVKPVFGSETAPSLADRDTYLFEERNGRMVPMQAQGHRECAYSPKAFTWAATAEVALRAQIDSPWSAGEFVWCTFDYLGEPNHTGRRGKEYWPARSSYWGICDLAGMPKDRYYLYRSIWNTEARTVHLMPDWTHPGSEGKIFAVWCYTNAKEAELFLNGRSQGVRRFADTKDLHLSWDVAYEPGVIEVRARYADGAVALDSRETAGPVATLRKTKIFESGGVAYFRFDAVDANGVRVLSCEDEVAFNVSEGEFVCAVSGSTTDHTPFTSRTRRLFRGSVVAVLRGTHACAECRLGHSREDARSTVRSTKR